jgi:hypothetical protein
MATTSTPTLKIEKITGSTSTGTVFTERIQLIGDDDEVATDINIAPSTFPAQAFAVSSATNVVNRVRTGNVLKSLFNEDPELVSTGAEANDEILARITLAYAANPPIPSALPSPTLTNMVRGAWK